MTQTIGRLGLWLTIVTLAAGAAMAESATATDAAKTSRRDGKHFYLQLEDADTAVITSAHYDRWIAHLDAAYEAMLDLVGRAPFGGAKIGIESTRTDPGGWAVAGNPILWARQFVRESLAHCDATDDWCFGIVHEIGHDFDEDAWNFNAEFFANFKLHYVVETLKGKITHGKQYTGKELAAFWKTDAAESYARAWCHPDPAKRTAHHDGLQHKMLLVKEKMGWEPFKKTFRHFLALPADQRPRGDWERFKAFHDTLAKYAGFDVWTLYTAEELKMLRAIYK